MGHTTKQQRCHPDTWRHFSQRWTRNIHGMWRVLHKVSYINSQSLITDCSFVSVIVSTELSIRTTITIMFKSEITFVNVTTSKSGQMNTWSTFSFFYMQIQTCLPCLSCPTLHRSGSLVPVCLCAPFISQCMFLLFPPFQTFLKSHWTHQGLFREQRSNLTVYSRGAWPSFSTAIWLVRFKVSLTFLKSSMLPYCTSTTSPCREEQTHKLSLSTGVFQITDQLYSQICAQQVTLTSISTLSFVMVFLFLYSEASFALNFCVNSFGI